MINFRPVMTRPNRIRGDRGIVQRGGFLVIKRRGRKPQLRRVSQRGGRGLSSRLKKLVSSALYKRRSPGVFSRSRLRR